MAILYSQLTAGVTGKGGIWRIKPPDAESAVGAADPKVRAKPRTCPVVGSGDDAWM
jgi:hypothetical protein